MRYIVLIIWTIFCPWDAIAQLPARQVSASVKDHKANLTVLPAILENKGPASLISVAYQSTIQKWSYSAEVSRLERIFPTGVAFVSRNHHVSIQQAVQRKFTFRKKYIQLVNFRASGFHVRDEKTFQPATSLYEIQSMIRTIKGTTIGLQVEQRVDNVTEVFTFDGQPFCADRYKLRNITIHTAGITHKRFSNYTEVSMGTYYGGSNRYAIRIGEYINISKRLNAMADVEFSRVNQNRSSNGLLTRIKIDYQPHSHVRAGLFALHNSFANVAGLMAFAQYTISHHQFKVEYRELRNQNLQLIETTNPFFASNYLIQYLFHVPVTKASKG